MWNAWLIYAANGSNFLPVQNGCDTLLRRMTTQHEPAQQNRFVGTFLPWLVAAAGLIFYLATLSRWYSLGNLTTAARLTGDLPGAELYAPLYFLATYPLHWMPAHWAPLALNIFSAVCAALTLGQLARSVALLPHDRTHDQRLREEGEFSLLSIRDAWLPPVMAAAVLGLQLTIWEGATSGTRELLDLLLAAYIIRCLLEFRIDERDSWLYRAAGVYGLAMTENWVLIGLLPAFVGAMVWIRGISFFNLRFLRWLILCGLAGLLLYLLLPLVYVNSGFQEGTFWQALKVNLKAQKDILSLMIHRAPGNVLLLLALTSLLPILLISVKWASYFGDPSPVGIALTTGIFHLSHGTLLGACLWAAFDPAFGPRYKGFGLPSLILLLIYFGALSIGYFSGYFLVVFRPLKERTRYVPFWKTALHRLAQVVMWLLLLLVPAGLIYKNLPQIRLSNGATLRNFATQLTQNLPAKAVVLSDDPMRLLLAKSWLARDGNPSDRIFLNTQNLLSPNYFNEQQKLHPTEWLGPVDPKKLPQGVDPRTLITLLLKFSEQRPVYYLHPSFGYYFEYFYPVPHGLVYEMRRTSTNAVAVPPLTDSEIVENETFWSRHADSASELLPFITEPPTKKLPTFRQKLLKKLHVPFEPSPMAITLGNYYSLALNFWGVQSEVAGRLPEAQRRFELSLKLNQNNISARRNLEFNKDLQAGVPTSVQSPKSLEADFGKYRDGPQIMRECGPFDEPTHRFAQGVIFGQTGLNRQAAQQFERIAALVPDYLPSQLWLAQFYVINRFPEKALSLIPKIRAAAEASADSGVGKFDLLKIEVSALFSAGKSALAEQKLRELMNEYPKDINLLSLAFQLSTTFKSYTNALRAVDFALELKPDDVGALVNKGYLSIQVNDHPTAIAALTTALSYDTNNATAKLNRAIAYLASDKLQAAQQDYSELEKLFPNMFQIYYGLGEIAWRNKDTNNAIRNYDLYLANAPAETDEAKTISERLQNLRTAAP